jgi:hypothetical protein
MHKKAMLVALAALAAAIVLAAARAQPMHSHDAGEKAANTGPYAPGLGEIMALQQMRHSKLWFAGAGRNWELAGYELDELKEGFEDAAKLYPTVNGVSLAQAISAIKAVDIPELGTAISARDRTRFATAFDKLTASCNACHQSTAHGFIVIQRPAALPYTNQSFRPPLLTPPRSGHQH